MTRSVRTPLWVSIADAATIALLAASAFVAITGGLRIDLFGTKLVVLSAERHFLRGIAIAVVRHLVYRRPSLLERLAAGWRLVSTRWPTAASVAPLVLGTRIGVLLVGYAAVVTFGYVNEKPPFRFSASELVNLPVRWDAGWYLGIAFGGYAWSPEATGQQNIAFFPAYPLLVRAAGLFRLSEQTAHVSAWVAVGVSVAALFGALLYLWRLARRFGTDDTGYGAALLLCCYPFGVFLGVPYSEALFLLCAVGAFHHQFAHQPVRAGAWGLLAGLSRPNGCFLSIPLAIIAVLEAWRLSRTPGAERPLTRKGVRAVAPLLASAAMPGLGMLAYSAVMWHQAGDAFLWIAVQKAGWGRSVDSSELLREQLDQFASLGVLGAARFWPYEVLNFVPAVLALACLWPVTRRLGLAMGSFVALNLIVPLAYGGLTSLGRFTAVQFPVFLWLALALPPRATVGLATAFAVGQGLVAALFFTWRPVF